MDFLMKGCSCKRGNKKGCKTKQCAGAVSKTCSNCGPGCNCKGCTNLPVATQIEDEDTDEEGDPDELEGTNWSGTQDEDDDNATCIQSEIFTALFTGTAFH